MAAIQARSRGIGGGVALVRAIQIETFGSPAEVAKAVDVPDVGAPGAGEVVIALEASPINQYDL